MRKVHRSTYPSPSERPIVMIVLETLRTAVDMHAVNHCLFKLFVIYRLLGVFKDLSAYNLKEIALTVLDARTLLYHPIKKKLYTNTRQDTIIRHSDIYMTTTVVSK